MPSFGDNRRARVAARRRLTLVIAVALTSAAIGVLIVDHDPDTPSRANRAAFKVGAGIATAAPSPTPTAAPSPTPTPAPTSTPAAASTSTSICVSSTHPQAAARMSAAIAATLAQRPDSVVAFDASDQNLGVTCSLHPTWHFHSASVIKVTILSALLYKIGGVGHMTTAQHNLAQQMITQSNNSAATALWNEVGIGAMQNFLNRAGMHSTVLSDAWGLTQITAQDELTLLQAISYPSLLGQVARSYVLSLMAEVTPSQRWGVSEDVGAGVTVHIKNGWLAYPDSDDWIVNSLGIFTGTNINYQMAVLNAAAAGGQSEGYGIATDEDVAGIVNKNLAGLYALFGLLAGQYGRRLIRLTGAS